MVENIFGIVFEVMEGHAILDMWQPDFRSDPPELQEAYDRASRVIEEDPDNLEAFFMRGVVCQSKKWYEQALADFGEVVRLDPNHARAWLLVSEVMHSLGEFDKSRTIRQHALELDPTIG